MALHGKRSETQALHDVLSCLGSATVGSQQALDCLRKRHKDPEVVVFSSVSGISLMVRGMSKDLSWGKLEAASVQADAY